MTAFLFLLLIAIILGACVQDGQFRYDHRDRFGHSAWTGLAMAVLIAGVFWLLWRD